jgi:hypothetical protein
MGTNNMTMNVKNGKLIIEVHVSKEAVEKALPSSSGKTRLVSSTGGFVAVGDLRVGLNVTAQR